MIGSSELSDTGNGELPYWRLGGFYFFYFGTLGALLPYWGLYLNARGFSPLEIGGLMAVLTATKIVAPNIWGWLADHRGRRMSAIQVGSILAASIFALVWSVEGWLGLALVICGFSFFWNAALPQFEAHTLNHLGDSVHAYTHIRVWGSIGFIVTVAIVGELVERTGIGSVPISVLMLLSLLALVSLSVPERVTGYLPRASESIFATLRQPVVLAVLAACFLMQLAHGPYYAFFSIYLEGYGYSPRSIGLLWALGVLAEVAAFLLLPALLFRRSDATVIPGSLLSMLLLASLVCGVLRWGLVAAFPGSLAVLLFAQLLHAATFGVYHASAIQLIHQLFPGRLQGRGQALYSSLSFGAGVALGSLLSGMVWTAIGPRTSFLFASFATALGCIIVWKWARIARPEEADSLDRTAT